ncbi:hypothetical protein, partial [Oenococcus oeni]
PIVNNWVLFFIDKIIFLDEYSKKISEISEIYKFDFCICLINKKYFCCRITAWFLNHKVFKPQK